MLLKPKLLKNRYPEQTETIQSDLGLLLQDQSDLLEQFD